MRGSSTLAPHSRARDHFVGETSVLGAFADSGASAASFAATRSSKMRSSRSSREIGVHIDKSRGARGSSLRVTSVEKLPSDRV